MIGFCIAKGFKITVSAILVQKLPMKREMMTSSMQGVSLKSDVLKSYPLIWYYYNYYSVIIIIINFCGTYIVRNLSSVLLLIIHSLPAGWFMAKCFHNNN